MAGNISMLVALIFVAALARRVPAASAVYASYHMYDSSQTLLAASVYCSTYDSDKSASWRSQYPWTAYCVGGGAANPSNCGKCLKVTNTATGVSTKVRIVDHCSNGGIDLEQKAFNTIDTDRAGYARGHLDVKVAFVKC